MGRSPPALAAQPTAADRQRPEAGAVPRRHARSSSLDGIKCRRGEHYRRAEEQIAYRRSISPACGQRLVVVVFGPHLLVSRYTFLS